MSTDLHEAYRNAGSDVPLLGDVEAAVRAGRRRRLATVAAAPVALVAVVAGAWALMPGGDDGTAGEPAMASVSSAPATADDLAGRSFIGTPFPGEGAAPLRLTFGSRRVTVDPGCNAQSAPYAVEAGRLILDGALTSTGGGVCLRGVGSPAWLSKLVSASPKLVLDGKRLTLRSERYVMDFTDVAAVPAEPEPTSTVDTEGMVGGTFVSAGAVEQLDGESLVVMFTHDRVRAYAGCSTLDGRWRVDGNALLVDDVTRRPGGCANGEAVAAALSDLLTLDVAVAVAGDELTLQTERYTVLLSRSDVAQADPVLQGSA